jgi:hypothetical protein
MARSRVLSRLASLLAVGLIAGAAPAPEARFDYRVRDLFFSGFAGVVDDLAEGMARCEAALAVDPDNPEALVWHGAGTFFQAGIAFRQGDPARGRALQERGLAEMARAAALKPDHPATLVPRAAMLMGAAQQVSNPAIAEPWLRTAVGDYEAVVAFHAPTWSTLSGHAAGELLAGLAEGWDRLGDAPKSRAYLARIVAELPGSSYAGRAEAWIAAGHRTERLTCLSCHKSAAN